MKKTVYNRFVCWAAKGIWVALFKTLARAGGPPSQVPIAFTVVKAHRCAAGGQRGEQSQAISRSRSGRTTKIHALTDHLRRALAFLLTSRQAADCKAGALLLERLPTCRIVLADEGCDSDAIRRQIEGLGAASNIPPKINRRRKRCFSPVLYRGRNAIERMFSRHDDFRRIATCYDRRAIHSLAAVCLAATVGYWLLIQTLLLRLRRRVQGIG